MHNEQTTYDNTYIHTISNSTGKKLAQNPYAKTFTQICYQTRNVEKSYPAQNFPVRAQIEDKGNFLGI